MTVPRKEHPKPQYKREQWLNLNGQWDFAFDFGLSGQEKGWAEGKEQFLEKIMVPFCPESELSGLGYKDFIPAVWYQRDFEIPAEWGEKKVLLHFGAVDYEARVWVNGQYVGTHRGGSSSFKFEITDFINQGENRLVVNARDDLRSGEQPGGKQSKKLKSHGCVYTRVTGIWQTVWLEAVPEYYLEDVHIVPDYDNGCFNLTPRLNKEKENLSFRAVISSSGQEIAAKTIAAGSGKSLKLELTDPHAWNLEDPFLYDLSLELLEKGKIIDRVKSYAGLRKFHIENNKFFLNNEQIFLRLVLDQGFYPDGIWTAPDDQELKADIERAQKVGFNGARLHQKVFAERYHYWADKLGYLTWGEFSDWGLDLQKLAAIHNHRREWGEVVVRDRNHPSIVAWTPFNETANYGARKYRESYTQAVEDIYTLTKNLDPTRPINDASGYIHVETDIYTVHDYDQNPDSFAERYAQVDPENPEKAFVNFPDNDAPYQGEPYVVDEYGGTYWTKEYAEKPTRGGNREEWGYGKSEQEVLDRIEKLTLPLLDNPEIAGYTYTQLTDVEQEVNGIYTYDRKLKFSLDRLQEIFGREEV